VPRLISVNVGLPRDIEWQGQTVHTAIWKGAVSGPRMVRRLNIDGDAQGDLEGHGGEHRAVMVYQLESYRYWEGQLGRNDLIYGQFGENFTVEGLPDDAVCIGDRYRIGKALFEVTQPRVTCYRVGIRMNQSQMAALLVSHHRPGFYFRVLEEGEVSSGDEIFKVSDGPENITVADIDALLYLPGHLREQLERALKIPALSPGWRSSLQALISQRSETTGGGNAGLRALPEAPPAWRGFRPLRVARIDRESAGVLSFSFQSIDGSPLPAALPGQFLVLKLKRDPDASLVLRSYSMSGRPGGNVYRISVKQETNGAASSYLHDHVAAGDLLEVSAPRGSFTLGVGDRPLVFLSVGIGATPVLAMLHSLVSGKQPSAAQREVWWIYGARNRDNHPFALESQELLQGLPRSRRYIAYSRPGPEDRLGKDYDARGHLGTSVIEQLSLPRNSDFYLCGPPPFLKDFTGALKNFGVPANQVHTEAFGPGESLRPGVTSAANGPVHGPAGEPGTGPQVAFIRSGLTVAWSSQFQSFLELAEACDVPVRWSCRAGVCHTCESGLVGGTVDYEPEPLDRAAEGNLLICCSRPHDDVQLDL
jgi:MOSC domain-containing protein YiiM/ferredoxin-NADP reductase/ferredoxin